MADQVAETDFAAIQWTADSSSWLSEEFDDTHLVFFKPSGETHFLNFLSFGALEQLGQSPQTCESLRDNLIPRFDVTEEELPLSLVEKVLQQLDEAGLIFPSVCNASDSQ